MAEMLSIGEGGRQLKHTVSNSVKTISHTNNALGKWLVLERGQAEVTNLHRAGRTSDEDIVTLEVTVDHGRSATVEEQQTFQDLSTPVLENVQVDASEPLYVAANMTDTAAETLD